MWYGYFYAATGKLRMIFAEQIWMFAVWERRNRVCFHDDLSALLKTIAAYSPVFSRVYIFGSKKSICQCMALFREEVYS